MFISAERSKARREKDPVRYFYYKSFDEQENLIAAAGWEQFKGSWAYERFVAINRDKIKAMIESDNYRFPGTWKQTVL